MTKFGNGGSAAPGQNLKLRTASKACSATWILCTNPSCSSGPSKATENFDQVGRSRDPPDTY
jgi:hypothetical protein